jgi:hypothetical protein
MQCIGSGSMLAARVVDVSAVAQGDDVSHSGLVGDQSCRHESGESKLGEHAPVSCTPVTSGLIALDAKMKCYWRLIEVNQCYKGDEKRRVVSRNRNGASSRSTNMVAGARCCCLGSRAVIIIGSKTNRVQMASPANAATAACCEFSHSVPQIDRHDAQH